MEVTPDAVAGALRRMKPIVGREVKVVRCWRMDLETLEYVVFIDDKQAGTVRCTPEAVRHRDAFALVTRALYDHLHLYLTGAKRRSRT